MSNNKFSKIQTIATRKYSIHPEDDTKMVCTITDCKYPCKITFDKDAYPIVYLYNWTPMIRHGKLHSFAAKKHDLVLGKYIMDCTDDETVLHLDGDSLNYCRDNLCIVPRSSKSLAMFKRFIPDGKSNHPNVFKTVVNETISTKQYRYEYITVFFKAYVKYKKNYSLLKYSEEEAYRLANKTALQVHERFLRSTEYQDTVLKVNNFNNFKQV